MTERDTAVWRKARRARDTLVEQFLDRPEVNLIDIGQTTEKGKAGQNPVLRIHVSERWMNAKSEDRVTFPEEVDGIPVIVLFGEYRIETGSSTNVDE